SPLPASATIASGSSSTAAQYDSVCIGVRPRLPDAHSTPVRTSLMAERSPVVGPVDGPARGGQLLAPLARTGLVHSAVDAHHAVGLVRLLQRDLPVDHVGEHECGIPGERIAMS